MATCLMKFKPVHANQGHVNLGFASRVGEEIWESDKKVRDSEGSQRGFIYGRMVVNGQGNIIVDACSCVSAAPNDIIHCEMSVDEQTGDIVAFGEVVVIQPPLTCDHPTGPFLAHTFRKQDGSVVPGGEFVVQLPKYVLFTVPCDATMVRIINGTVGIGQAWKLASKLEDVIIFDPNFPDRTTAAKFATRNNYVLELAEPEFQEPFVARYTLRIKWTDFPGQSFVNDGSIQFGLFVGRDEDGIFVSIPQESDRLTFNVDFSPEFWQSRTNMFSSRWQPGFLIGALERIDLQKFYVDNEASLRELFCGSQIEFTGYVRFRFTQFAEDFGTPYNVRLGPSYPEEVVYSFGKRNVNNRIESRRWRGWAYVLPGASPVHTLVTSCTP